MEAERERFRTYIEKSGVMSALTNVLVNLYEEPSRPNDALDYIKKALGTIAADPMHLAMLEDKVKEQQQTIESLEAKIASLQDQLSAREGGEAAPADSVPDDAPPADAAQGEEATQA